MLVAFNAFLTPIAEEMAPSEPADSNGCDFVRKYLYGKKNRVDKKSMRELLSDHSAPICAHGEINTLRSVVAKTNERKIIVADGHPCISKFEEILIPT